MKQFSPMPKSFKIERRALPGIDFFRDGFATVRKGNLPSGQHSDPRMNEPLFKRAKPEISDSPGEMG